MNQVEVDTLRQKATRLRAQAQTMTGLAFEQLEREATRLDGIATKIELASILEQRVA